MTDVNPLIGRSKAALDTPSLLVDLDVFERNVALIAQTCRAHGVSWRPHIKSHKSPAVARRLIASGAIGITCAKLAEAEVMAEAGIGSILIANQIVGEIKIERLMRLLGRTEVIVAVDSPANIVALGEAARAAGMSLPIVIEVDVGMRRAGVLPGQPVRHLAQAIGGQRGLRLRGLMGWESHTVLIGDPSEKARAIERAIQALVESAALCRVDGHELDIVSCGGTGTFPYCCGAAGITEVQIGGGVFSDLHYVNNYHVELPFALTLLATVTSRPNGSRIVLDAGKKQMSSDASMPMPIGLEDVKSVRLSAEHATIELALPNARPQLGERVEFVVGYSDTTIHLHPEILAMRDGVVAEVWPVLGRTFR